MNEHTIQLHTGRPVKLLSMETVLGPTVCKLTLFLKGTVHLFG